MKKFIFTCLLLLATGANASSFKGEILCDPVNEINSLIISENTVVEKSFHYINGEPVQCLRLSLSHGTSRTSLFVRIKVNDLKGKNTDFICAVAGKEKNKIAQCRLIANGAKMFDAVINTDQPMYFRGKPTIDNSGSVNLSFEIFYASSKDVFAIDLILPALIGLKKTENSYQEPDLQFGMINSNKLWRFADTGNKNLLNTNEFNNIFLVPKIELVKVISKSIKPYDDVPVKILAVLKNTGWKDYVYSSDNALKIYVDKKAGITDEKKRVQLIPDVPAKGFAEIEWTIHTHKKNSKITGEVRSNFLNIKTNFSVRIFSHDRLHPNLKENKGWNIIANQKENLITYDWLHNNLKVRFVKSASGIQNVQFSFKNNNKFKTVATVDKLASVDVITPNNKIKRLVFLPKSVQYIEMPENKILVRGWAFSKETGGLTIEQYYSRSENNSEIIIETKIIAKNNMKIAGIANPVFNLEADENSTLIIPGFKFEKLLPRLLSQKYKWMFDNSINCLIPLSKQLVPFAWAGSSGGSICFKESECSFNKDNMMWEVEKNSLINSRYTFANVAKPFFGNVLKHLKTKESVYFKSYLEIVSENVGVNELLPSVLQLGVIPVPLINAEKSRLMDKFTLSIGSTNLLTTNINNNEDVKLKLLDLCTEYDWTLDKKISGKIIVDKARMQKLSDDILLLVIEGNNSENKDSISLGLNLLSKLRNILIYSFNDIPDLSTYAKLAKANISAYKIGGDKLFLKEANRLLHLGEIFMRKSAEKRTRGIGMAEEKVGESTPGNYEGLISTDATLLLIDALFDAAKADDIKAARNNRLANLLLNAVEKFYLQKNKDGLIPEFYSREFDLVSGKYMRPYFLREMFLRQNKLSN